MFCLGESPLEEGFELEMDSELIVIVNAAADRSMPIVWRTYPLFQQEVRASSERLDKYLDSFPALISDSNKSSPGTRLRARLIFLI